MKLTIGIPSFNNHAETWFTVQALRMYQDLTDTEILIVDNFGDEALKNFVTTWASSQVRYVRHEPQEGPASAKNRVFAEAQGEWVLCMDSHVLLAPGCIARLRAWCDAHKDCMDLLHGYLLYDNLTSGADAMNDEWRGHMWGTWREMLTKQEQDVYSIPMHGMGLFACRKDAWLGFNPAFRGFGGEEGYIHAKYRKAGKDVKLLPFLRWNHYFRPGAPPFPLNLNDRIQNYLIGFEELGLDPAPVHEHFNIKARTA